VHADLWGSLGLVVLVLITALLARRKGQLATIDVGLAAFAIAIYMVPLVAGAQISQYRGHTLLVPAVLVLRHLRSWLIAVLAVASIPLAYAMATLFYTSQLL
jgi:hypothetical protein